MDNSQSLVGGLTNFGSSNIYRFINFITNFLSIFLKPFLEFFLMRQLVRVIKNLILVIDLSLTIISWFKIANWELTKLLIDLKQYVYGHHAQY